MTTKNKLAPTALPFSHQAALQQLVEHRRAFTFDTMELNVYETHRYAERVPLRFNDLTITAMLKGKKVMHLFGKAGFDYLPGESVIVPPGELMEIDFPEASVETPSQCIALVVASERIQRITELLNERFPKAETGDCWQLSMQDYHLTNNRSIVENINKLIQVATENHAAKDLLANLTLEELLIRLMQTQARRLLLQARSPHVSHHRMAFVADYIHKHLHENISINKLASLACMSRAAFFRAFKREFGISPLEFIHHERINQAKYLLADPRRSITEVCYMVGFRSLNFFIKIFKRITGVCPSTYRQSK
ncbi:MAG: AraC family transcriptional regulator [Cytophagales bacterium]|nr:AraC family transcriptional regulator [Cytophagales bacterium]